MYNHYRKTRQNYRKHNAGDTAGACSFCEKPVGDLLVAETEHNRIMLNRVRYDLWEHHKVIEHLLVVPKRHVLSLGELTDTEQLDMMRICADYEAKGYSIYARAVGSPRRSVAHQHTHLIKISPQVVRAGLYVKKPYITITI